MQLRRSWLRTVPTVILLCVAIVSPATAETRPQRATTPPSRGCVWKNPDEQRLVDFPASRVLTCLMTGLPVELDGVRIVARCGVDALDLSRLAVSKVPASGRITPAVALDVAAVERQTGRRVSGARVVRERFIIRKSEIAVPLRGPEARRNDAAPFAPLVFAKVVSFENSRFAVPVDLEAAHFFGDVSFNGALVAFEKPEDSQRLAEATFVRDADFECMRAWDERRRGTTDWSHFSFKEAVFLGKVRFGCGGRWSDIGYVDFSSARFEGPSPRFDDRLFVAGADFSSVTFAQKAYFPRAWFAEYVGFNSTVFRGGAAFNRARFLGPADFTQARFGTAGDTSFDDALFFAHAMFPGATFESALNFVGVEGQLASVDFEGVTFVGPANFHRARLAIVNFSGAAFRKPARFTSAQFGSEVRCGRLANLALNLERATFDDRVDFTAARLLAPLSFSYTSYAPGSLHAAWHQFDKLVHLGPVQLSDDPDCESLRTFEERADAEVMPATEFYRVLEANFREQGRLSDATDAYFLREQAETRWRQSRGKLEVGREFMEWVWGYGVRPSRVLRSWGYLIGIGAFLYLFLGRRLVNVGEALSVPRFRPVQLPVVPEEPEWLRATRRPTAGLVRHVLRAVTLSADAGTGFQFTSVRLEATGRHWGVGVMAVERSLGYLLLGALVISAAQSVPVLGQMLSFLLK